MAEVRYYTDEHVSRAIIRGLRNRGINVLAAQEEMMLGASDGPSTTSFTPSSATR